MIRDGAAAERVGMSHPASVDLSRGAVTLYNVRGWLDEEVRPLQVGALTGLGITVAWAASCSLVEVADVLSLGAVVFVLPSAFLGSALLRWRGMRIMVDAEGVRRDNRHMPAVVRPLAPAWSVRWQDLDRVDVHERVKGLGTNQRTITEMWLVLRNGSRIRVLPHYWLTRSGMAQQPSLERLKWFPVGAMPLGQAVQKWAPQDASGSALGDWSGT
jgi:hypothetical protein